MSRAWISTIAVETQNVVLAVVEGAHLAFEFGRAHPAVRDHEFRLRQCSLRAGKAAAPSRSPMREQTWNWLAAIGARATTARARSIAHGVNRAHGEAINRRRR